MASKQRNKIFVINIHSKEIYNNIKGMPILITNTEDKLEIYFNVDFSIRIAAWASKN